MSIRDEHSPRDLNLVYDVQPAWERFKVEIASLTVTILSLPMQAHYDLMCQQANLARVLAQADRERIDGAYRSTCYPTLYRYTKLLRGIIGKMVSVSESFGWTDVDAETLRKQCEAFTRIIDELWELADVVECPACGEPSWECDCVDEYEEDTEDDEDDEESDVELETDYSRDAEIPGVLYACACVTCRRRRATFLAGHR